MAFAYSFFFRRINSSNLGRIAIAIGLGFGIGEAWNIAALISQLPEFMKYPWYMLFGFISERMLVCIGHAAFVAVAAHFIIFRRAIFRGVVLGMLLHFFGNFPIYLAHKNTFGLGKDVWSVALQIWVAVYFLAMGALLARMAVGKKWMANLFRGKMKCPECGSLYRRPIFRIQPFYKSYEKCPSCKHWHLVSAFDDGKNKSSISVSS